MKLIFKKILKQAIEYGFVDIKIRKADKKYRISISNSGEDIPKENIGKIFNKFYQADESHASGGNGIGLAIVKRIVELHCGKTAVENKDGMVVFKITLPKKIQI